ncbi:type II toxin-antitoxin system VapC family toxin [Crenothrix sp.]|uniref:type II toxin-antitoxin system VapC family toxin n=1 Tax=Crenothrix sp. TaxID=3100433 RepID=UPI00374DC61E
MGRLIYLLDTNIISEPTKRQPNKNVLHHLEKQDGHYCIAAPVWHELHYGCALLPDSKRKNQLQSYLKLLMDNGLDVLPYDIHASTWFAMERGRLQRQGLSCNYTDGEIAAIAASQSLIMVTRNTTDFQNFQGLTLQNWFYGII